MSQENFGLLNHVPLEDNMPTKGVTVPRWLQWINENAEKPLLIVGMLAIIFIITYQTGIRYLVSYAHDPFTEGMFKDAVSYILTDIFNITGNITWTEETSRYLFIWITYLAIPVAIRERSNIRVDLFYDKMPQHWQRILWITMDLLFLAFAAIIFFQVSTRLFSRLNFPRQRRHCAYPIPFPIWCYP